MTKENQNQTRLLTLDGIKQRKELKTRLLPEGLYVVFYEGGGELPQQLQGSFTTIFAATRAIEAYKAIPK